MPDRRRPSRLVLLAPAAVCAVDAVLAHRAPPRLAAAVLDEAAHLVTTLLFLGAVGMPPSTPALGGAVAGAVLLDLDHLPKELGWDGLTRGSRRPYAHSLAGVAGAVLLAARLRRPPPATRAAAAGLVLHLVRDMATGGVPLLWPLTRRGAAVPYASYAAALVLWAGLLVRRPARRREA
jgi:inner membrane protein